MKKKYIGICTPKEIDINKDSIYNMPFYACPDSITKMIVKNNCLPILLQYEEQLVDDYLDMIDGLVLTGDGDIDPKFYGERLKKIDKDMGLMADEKMIFQNSIIEKILVKKEKKIPILGICAGLQSINVALGGTLIQDINDEITTNIEHKLGDDAMKNIGHIINIIDKNSFIYRTTKKDSFGVNTNHHQAIKKLGNNLKVTATSEKDNIIEAIEYIGDSLCVAFQWHPEEYAAEEDNLLLQAFFNEIK